MAYEVPALPYAYDALEPIIDAETMRVHHDRHHQAYVDKLNGALAGTPLADTAIEKALRGLKRDVPEEIRDVVRNNGGGHLNHSLFWESMSPGGGGAPTGELAYAIRSGFSSFQAFQQAFEAAGLGQFGSGWVWLVADGMQIKVVATPNQDNPLLTRYTPLLGNDVWEHAYYISYQNRRADYLKAWWDLVDWNVVADRYAAARR